MHEASAPNTTEDARPLVVITTTVALNGGDAAILFGQCDTVRQAFGPVRIVVFDQQAEASARYHPGVDFRPSLFWMRGRSRPGGAGRALWGLRLGRLLVAATALRRGHTRLARRLCPTSSDFDDLMLYRSADVVLTNGGTMLVEHYNLLPRLVDYVVVLILGRPLVFFTQSLGPFTRPILRRSLAAILRRARLVLVRGEESRAHVLGLGTPAQLVRTAPDAAFLLADGDALGEPRAGRRGDDLRVGLSVREWPFFRSLSRDVGQAGYESAVADLCSHLVRRQGARVTFISTCQGTPEYWADDAGIARRIVSGLPPDVAAGVAVDGDFHSPLDLRDRYGGLDLVVATRMHAAILAMAGGTPVLAIAYEPKTREVFAQLGLAEWVIDIEGVDGARLVDRVDALLGQLERVRAEMAAGVAGERSGAMAAAWALRDALPDLARRAQPS